MRETELQRLLLLAAPAALPSARFFPRVIIAGRIEDRFVRAGIAGQADVYVLLRGGGHVEIELKGARTAITDAQLAWETFCVGWGIPYLRLRALAGEAPSATVARWIAEITVLLNRL